MGLGCIWGLATTRAGARADRAGMDADRERERDASSHARRAAERTRVALERQRRRVDARAVVARRQHPPLAAGAARAGCVRQLECAGVGRTRGRHCACASALRWRRHYGLGSACALSMGRREPQLSGSEPREWRQRSQCGRGPISGPGCTAPGRLGQLACTGSSPGASPVLRAPRRDQAGAAALVHAATVAAAHGLVCGVGCIGRHGGGRGVWCGLVVDVAVMAPRRRLPQQRAAVEHLV